MKIPVGIDIEEGEKDDYVLKMLRNIYGQKQAGGVWNKYLHGILMKLGFEQSQIDEGVYFRRGVIYLLYTDDSLLASKNETKLNQAMKDIQDSGLKITIEGDLEEFLGVHIRRTKDGKFEMTQPNLANQICKDLGFKDNTKEKNVPAASSKILKRHQTSKRFDNSFNYRSVVGKINYYEKCTRPDISYQAHQCARFVDSPRVEHGDAIKWLGRYIHGTKNKGIIYAPDPSRGLEVYVDADFAGTFDHLDPDNIDTARSRHGYIITYAGMPVIWKSQLQSEIALSSTESEYTGLSYSLREAIPIMDLLNEMKQKGISVNDDKTRVHIKVYEDNAGAIEIAKEKKYRPRTKHLSCKLHHFRHRVEVTKEISVHKIDTNDQPADMLTKPLREEDFVRHRAVVMGW